MNLSRKEFLDLDLRDENQEALKQRIRDLLWDCYTERNLKTHWVEEQFRNALKNSGLTGKEKTALREIYKEAHRETRAKIKQLQLADKLEEERYSGIMAEANS